jgi:hypothetical protein
MPRREVFRRLPGSRRQICTGLAAAAEPVFRRNHGRQIRPQQQLFRVGFRAQFPSPAAAIHEVGYRLKYSSLYINKKLDKLLAVYNPNAEYGQKVKSVMRRISPTE